MNKLVLIIVSVLLGSIGQVILKIGANKLGTLALHPQTLITDLIRMVRVPEIIIGLLFFGSSFVLWVKVLTKFDLSYAYPMVSLGYINVVVLSYFLFKEPFTTAKIAGIAFIIVGVIILNR
ncbi:transporter [Anaerobacillus alkaliphilus]|uniref:Transporter n=1 Tax=Anaerobacillus alkaliphilus TaxID=1548597 RepID=A0A4Q0VWA1_9BACI|nr:EamA family transporter [Anaerobacillus alkaliphilus]RXJ02944.1 transporter [Anaerobacillus alkaliphilus]